VLPFDPDGDQPGHRPEQLEQNATRTPCFSHGREVDDDGSERLAGRAAPVALRAHWCISLAGAGCVTNEPAGVSSTSNGCAWLAQNASKSRWSSRGARPQSCHPAPFQYLSTTSQPSM